VAEPLTPYKIAKVMEGLGLEFRGRTPEPSNLTELTPEQLEAYHKAYDEFLWQVGRWVQDAYGYAFTYQATEKDLGEYFLSLVKRRGFDIVYVKDFHRE